VGSLSSSDIVTLDRIKISAICGAVNLTFCRINLLREGLDLPEVSLVAILDADKEGFLRSESSLIQTMAGPHAMLTGKQFCMRTGSRFNEARDRRNPAATCSPGGVQQRAGITPTTIIKAIESTLVTAYEADYFKVPLDWTTRRVFSRQDRRTIVRMESEMREAAKKFEFERAAECATGSSICVNVNCN